MELPPRAEGDRLLRAGEFRELTLRLRDQAARHDITTVIAGAFDHRTRMLPFFFADLRMAPAGPRAIGSAMLDAGFSKTRIVLQQWNRNFRASKMQLDGRIPDVFMVSSMTLHSARCREMMRDVWRMPLEKRPLIIAGGPLCIYEPWLVFGEDASDPSGADIAVTGEEYVALNLMEVLLSYRSPGGSMRDAFLRARDEGALDKVPGLVYRRGAENAPAEELVDTGIQRLLGDLNELPQPSLAYGILEHPGKGDLLAPRPMEASEVSKYAMVSTLIMTVGCKFSCEYCPIPAYNQRQLRFKTGDRMVEEIRQLIEKFGIRYYFGTDDNFFNNPERAMDIIDAIGKSEIRGKRMGKLIRLGTEVTVHDTLKMKDHLPAVRKSGVRALWLGVEDMSGALVRKGQGTDKTTECFQLLRQNGICPMPMMMHHDNQPLWSGKDNSGLMNQVGLLKKAGAVTLQVLMVTPSPGSRLIDKTYGDSEVIRSAGGREAQAYMHDGNYVVASTIPRPWNKQFNIMLAYLGFYNPFRMIHLMFSRKDRLNWKPIGAQIVGMWGLSYTIARTLGWAFRLMFGKIVRTSQQCRSKLPMRSPDSGRAVHDVRK